MSPFLSIFLFLPLDELGFTVWSLWSACNVECSDGQIFRTRECIDPTLETCNGTYRQNNTCYAGPCPSMLQCSSQVMTSGRTIFLKQDSSLYQHDNSHA